MCYVFLSNIRMYVAEVRCLMENHHANLPCERVTKVRLCAESYPRGYVDVQTILQVVVIRSQLRATVRPDRREKELYGLDIAEPLKIANERRWDLD